MSQEMPTPMLPPLRSNDEVAEHYADGPIGVDYFGGNLHITFFTIRSDHSVNPVKQYRQVTSRLVVPIAGAIDLQNTIANLISTLRQQGVVHSIMPGPQTRQ
jgi:hypothetical protein